MSLISHTEAEELRGKACDKWGSIWVHHYHELVVDAVISKLLRIRSGDQVGFSREHPKWMQDIDLHEVKKIIKYDPDTGEFTRISGAGKKRADLLMKIGYRSVGLYGKRILAHRLAWFLHYGKWPDSGMVIDHINGNREDNRIANLRVLTSSANCMSLRKSKPRPTNEGLPLGVVKHGRSFKAQIRIRGVVTSLGSFKTPELAAKARDDMAKKLISKKPSLNSESPNNYDPERFVMKARGGWVVQVSSGGRLNTIGPYKDKSDASTLSRAIHAMSANSTLKKLGIKLPETTPDEASVEWLPADDSEGGNC